MDVIRLCQLFWRRKIVVVPMILLVVGGLVFVYVASPKIYHTSGSIVLISPKMPDVAPGDTLPRSEQNPYTQFTDGSVLLDLVSRRMASAEVDQEMRKHGLVGQLTVGANLTFYHGPILDIAADSPSVKSAMNDVGIAMAEVSGQLVQLQTQQGTAPAFSIRTAVVVQPNGASRVLSSTLRRMVAAGVLGMLAILMSAIIAEGVTNWSRARATDRMTGLARRVISQQSAVLEEREADYVPALATVNQATDAPTTPGHGGLRLTTRARSG